VGLTYGDDADDADDGGEDDAQSNDFELNFSSARLSPLANQLRSLLYPFSHGSRNVR
jgi:hypothetical protein